MSRLSPEVERRRRLLTRTAPLALIAFVAFVVGAAVGAPGSPQLETASRFAEGWAAGNYAAMYAELNDASRAKYSPKQFKAAYREAAQVSTMRGLEAGKADDAQSREGTTVVPVPLAIATVAFGRLEDELAVPFADGGVAWEPSLVFPGLRGGEHLGSQVELAPRAPILAADGTPLAQGPADEREHPLGSVAIDVTGEVGEATEEDVARLAKQGFTAETPVGTSGLERAFNVRLAGKPGGSLLALDKGGASIRVLAQSEPQQGAPVKTTIDPDLQEAAVAALAGRFGGVAVLDARNGDVRAIAGQAFSAPQPPGSTFKIVTTTAALQKNIVGLDDEFEISDGINVGGRFIYNANGEFCGGTFSHAFAESCNAVFAPLGPKIGNDDFVATAERFGFNEPPSLYARQVPARSQPAGTDDPDRNPRPKSSLASRRSARGWCRRRRWRWRASPRPSPTAASAMPTSIVNNKKLRPEAEPVRVMSKKIADELTELMVGVVVEGTGYAAAIPEAQVAGKTGTAELGPKDGQEERGEPDPDQGRLVHRLRPGRKAEAGGRGAADRSRSRRRRSGGADRRPGPLRRPLGGSGGGLGLEVERDLGVLTVGAGDVEGQRPVLVHRFRQLEDRHRALDRALLRGRVEDGDLFLALDLAAEREGVEAFARKHVVGLAVGVCDRDRRGQRLRVVAFVLDFEEDAEVGVAVRRRVLADQVGGVLGVVRVQVAREGDVERELAQLHRLTLDHLLLVAHVAAGGNADGEQAEREGGEERQRGICGAGTSAGRSLLRGAAQGMPVAYRLPPATAIRSHLDPLGLEVVAQSPQRLAPVALLPDRPRREQLEPAIEVVGLGPVRHPYQRSGRRRRRSAPRRCGWGCG